MSSAVMRGRSVPWREVGMNYSDYGGEILPDGDGIIGAGVRVRNILFPEGSK